MSLPRDTAFCDKCKKEYKIHYYNSDGSVFLECEHIVSAEEYKKQKQGVNKSKTRRK